MRSTTTQQRLAITKKGLRPETHHHKEEHEIGSATDQQVGHGRRTVRPAAEYMGPCRTRDGPCDEGCGRRLYSAARRVPTPTWVAMQGHARQGHARGHYVAPYQDQRCGRPHVFMREVSGGWNPGGTHINQSNTNDTSWWRSQVAQTRLTQTNTVAAQRPSQWSQQARTTPSHAPPTPWRVGGSYRRGRGWSRLSHGAADERSS